MQCEFNKCAWRSKCKIAEISEYCSRANAEREDLLKSRQTRFAPMQNVNDMRAKVALDTEAA
jgi:hypothetical protein